jgi:general secretion pathway protein F
MPVGDSDFRYVGRDSDGAIVRAEIRASSAQEAYDYLARKNIVVTELRPAATLPLNIAGRTSKPEERVLLLRQLSILAKAGAPMLTAIETIAQSLADRPLGQQLRDAGDALRQGQSVSAALRTHVSGLPNNAHALIATGESTGKLSLVFGEAASQIAHEERMARALRTALIYPVILLSIATLAIGLLLVFVVPSFATLAAQSTRPIDPLAGAIFGVSAFLRAFWPLALAGIGAAIIGAQIYLNTPTRRARLRNGLARTRLFGPLLKALDTAKWARVMSLSLTAGVDVMEALSLAETGAPQGQFRDALTRAVEDIRRGKALDESFAQAGALDALDRSLLAAGQNSGALADVLAIMAERHEADSADHFKRLTVFVEQGAIAAVAIAIGLVVVSLISTITSIYDTIG